MLEIITGRAGSGKTEYCLQQICRQLIENPMGPAIILLLPEHMTYKVERKLAEMLSEYGRGYMRCQVYGFKRFAYQILQEIGGALKPGVTDMGRNLMLKQILDRRGKELKVFGRAARQRGFSAVLSNIINEFKGYEITPELLSKAADGVADTRLQNKLTDLSILYGDYNNALSNSYTDGKEIMSILSDKLPLSKTVAGADIWLDGFLFFNPLELRVIEGLMQYAANIHVTFNMDDMETATGQWANQEESGIFNRGYNTRNRLLHLAEKCSVQVEYRHFSQGVRFINPVLQALEAGFDKRRPEPVEAAKDLFLAEAATCRLEVEAAAADIIGLVRKKGYRWRDIGVLIRDEASYSDLLAFVFRDYDIPFFSDKKRQCANHPVAELVRSAIAVAGGWSYDNIFCCVKTGFFPLTFQQIDLLENYCLEFSLKGKAVWRREEPWTFSSRYSIDSEEESVSEQQQKRAGEADQLRRLVSAPLGILQDNLKNSENTRDMIRALYVFLTDMKVPETLQNWADQAEREGILDLAREHQQVWNDVMEMLDQLVEVCGETKMTIRELGSLLEEGLSSLEMALIPPGLDYVNIASFDKNALDNIKAVYILGANAGVMPGRAVESAVLSDADRMHINQQNVIELSLIGEDASFNENYLIYKAFTQAREYMWVSYSLSAPSGDAMTGAEITRKIRAMLPKKNIRSIPLDWIHEFSQEDQLTMLAKKRQALSYLAIALGSLRDEGDIPELWQKIYNYLLHDGEVGSIVELVRKGLFIDPKLHRLPRDIAWRLYAPRKILRGSVTKFERYNSCPFQYFMEHGLHLKERKVTRFGHPEFGTLMHAMLKEFGELLKKEKRHWHDIPEEERNELCDRLMDKLAPRINNEIMYSTKQLESQLARIKDTARFVLGHLAELDGASSFSPEFFEKSFGNPMHDRDNFTPSYDLGDGLRLELTGQIDRIDVNEAGSHFLVIDYKTGSAGIDVAGVYYGLKLQLLTYLLVANRIMVEHTGKPVLPAGMLYCFLKRPVLPMANHSHDPETIRKAMDKELRLSGWILDSRDIIEQLDSTFGEDKDNRFLPIRPTKKFVHSQDMDKLKSEQEFTALMTYMEHILRETGGHIMDGRIDIRPYKKKNKTTPCQYCKFHPICGFDARLPGYEYRNITGKDDELMMEIMDQAGENKDDKSDNGKERREDNGVVKGTEAGNK
ncbi:MAG: helicase-exonuclease AddAB subunit AddB [Anaerovibrio sp.]|uniref:helicase-exonuclease AddAB subunit AddB n=1 Tax=Anaerovibrio sp. TaxID=1872532 RepID=UPI0025ED90BC|nr:helicase-exonuclease AddAB subunit AddB [Anaerovibrio sp.]MCR5177039.1 helicase-exonuclease AddAB subunit AddB [Anaerovibrio sp.]